MESSTETGYIYRHAKVSDLRKIYDIQNIPYRKEVFDSSLPPFEEFAAAREQEMKSQTVHFFLLEQNHVLVGFSRFTLSNGTWLTTIWGKWLKTLCYASCIGGFDIVGFDKSVFAVRESNRRTVRICEEFGFHLAEQAPTVLFLDAAPYIERVMMNYYLITVEEFREKKEEWKKMALNFTVQIE